MSERPSPNDKRWAIWAGAIVSGFLAFSLVMGLVLLPMAQAPNADLDAWTAICRAIGLRPGTPAQRQPTSNAAAAPVSRVQWSPRTLKILASADARPGAQLAAAVCSSCHGEEGMSMTADFPRLAGQSPEAIYKQLSDYRSGARFNAQMTPIAQKLGEDELAEVAAYFGHMKSGPALGMGQKTVDDEQTRRLIFRGDPGRAIPPCEGCHARGAGGPPEAPVIAGQTAAYVERQLLAYRSGERRNDVYRRMRDVSARLTPAEIKNLAAAYQGTY